MFYYRYVDDTILCIKKNQLQSVLDTFNGYDKYLQFTHEIEIDNSINFLDLTIVKRGNNIITNWSQKPTCSGRLLNFNSHHTKQHKRNNISNLVDRAFLLSDKSFHSKNVMVVKEMLIKNDYPENFINTCIGSCIRKHKYGNNNSHINIINNPIATVALPFHKQFFYS